MPPKGSKFNKNTGKWETPPEGDGNNPNKLGESKPKFGCCLLNIFSI
jgi:hypothetical protein